MLELCGSKQVSSLLVMICVIKLTEYRIVKFIYQFLFIIYSFKFIDVILIIKYY